MSQFNYIAIKYAISINNKCMYLMNVKIAWCVIVGINNILLSLLNPKAFARWGKYVLVTFSKKYKQYYTVFRISYISCFYFGTLCAPCETLWYYFV